ncbi:hypothetical protein AAVH_27697 [Aphelenchoides avenae]|nr:hypothetical protein AAVH_27697 [Aphelenchus avenae]
MAVLGHGPDHGADEGVAKSTLAPLIRYLQGCGIMGENGDWPSGRLYSCVTENGTRVEPEAADGPGGDAASANGEYLA